MLLDLLDVFTRGVLTRVLLEGTITQIIEKSSLYGKLTTALNVPGGRKRPVNDLKRPKNNVKR